MDKKYYYIGLNNNLRAGNGVYLKENERVTIDSEEIVLYDDLEETIEDCNLPDGRHFLVEQLTDSNVEMELKNIRIIREISRDEIEEHIQDKTTGNSQLFLALYSPNVETLIELYNLEDEDVCVELTFNVNTPVYLLEKLAKEKNTSIRNEAQARLKEITQ